MSKAYFNVGIFGKGTTILIGSCRSCNVSKHSTRMQTCSVEIWPPSQWRRRSPAGSHSWKGTSIVKKSACIILNICTTHNGDYAPFRQRHFDLLPWNITPATELSLPLFLLKWRTLQSETGGIPPAVYMIALLQLLVCVQLDGLGWRVEEMGGHNLKLALF